MSLQNCIVELLPHTKKETCITEGVDRVITDSNGNDSKNLIHFENLSNCICSFVLG